MRVQSIRAPVQVGHVAGNRLFCLAVKMAFRKMHTIAERHYLAQEIRAMAEALQYPRYLLSARVRAPFIINFREFTGRICVFNKVDLVLHFLFHHGLASLGGISLLRCRLKHLLDCIPSWQSVERFCFSDHVRFRRWHPSPWALTRIPKGLHNLIPGILPLISVIRVDQW